MGQPERGLPPEFWSAPVVAGALASCDCATLMEQIRRAHGWTQHQLAEAVGYSQSWVSNVLRGRQALTVDQVRDVSCRLGVPLHALRFADRGGEDATERRDFGKAMALALVPLPREAAVDDTTAPALMAITGAQRRLDASLPARELARGAAAHADMAGRLLARARSAQLASGVAAAASEAAGFAAWLHADMGDAGSARCYYRTAIGRARHAGHDLLAGYMLGSLAAFELDSDDPDTSLTLIGQARRQAGHPKHPTPRAWLDAVEGLAHAARGDGTAADTVLARAEKAVGGTADYGPPPWPWVYPFDHPKLAGYRALAAVKLGRPAAALTAFGESLASAQPAPKQRAIVLLDVATAARQDGVSKKDSDQVDQAFRLACEGLSLGLAYASERVIARARRFRRGYDGPATSYQREFDELQHSALS